MSYPEDALVAGETLVLHQRPHWKMLLRPVLFLVLILIATGFLATVIADQSWAGTGWLVLAGVSVLAVFIFTGVPAIRWWTTHFVLTNKRVITRKGLIARDGLDIPMNRINSVRFRHSITDRIFGTGTLVIESASDEPLEFDNIRRVEHVHPCFTIRFPPGATPLTLPRRAIRGPRPNPLQRSPIRGLQPSPLQISRTRGAELVRVPILTWWLRSAQ